jgi:anti-sigma regulatory factor (Ser/Thr protein kinase)
MTFNLSFNVKGGDFSNAGKASSEIKKVLKKLNVEPKGIKRIVVATYEAEVNVVAHAWEGRIEAFFGKDEISVVVSDRGPGISDIEQAMQPGFSTASKKVREMGFGAGMGLANIEKNVDSLDIKSEVGEGTVLSFRCNYS